MERQTKVVDASVAVKWFVNEHFTEESAELLKRHLANEIVLYAPEIIIYELANALRYKNLNSEDIAKSVQDLIEFQIHLERPTETLIKRAAELSIRYKISMYDGFYAALADLLGTKLVTFDKELLKIPFSEKL